MLCMEMCHKMTIVICLVVQLCAHNKIISLNIYKCYSMESVSYYTTISSDISKEIMKNVGLLLAAVIVTGYRTNITSHNEG